MPVTCTNYKLKRGYRPLLNQPYPDQLKHKQQLEQRLLGRFAPVSPVLGQAEPWHYRNKATTFATGPRTTDGPLLDRMVLFACRATSRKKKSPLPSATYGPSNWTKQACRKPA